MSQKPNAPETANAPTSTPAATVETPAAPVQPKPEFIDLTGFQSVLKTGTGAKDIGIFAAALLLDQWQESASKKLTEIVCAFPCEDWHPYLLHFAGLHLEVGKSAAKKTTKDFTWEQITNAIRNAQIHYASLDEYKYSLSPELRPVTAAPVTVTNPNEPVYLLPDFPSYPAQQKKGMAEWEFNAHMTGLSDEDFAKEILKYHPEARQVMIDLHAAEKPAA